MAQRKAARKRSTTSKAARPTPRKSQTKQQRLIELLQRPEGATVEQMATTFGWQPHTVRGAISGALKKKLGLTIVSEKGDRGRVYRIASALKRS